MESQTGVQGKPSGELTISFGVLWDMRLADPPRRVAVDLPRWMKEFDDRSSLRAPDGVPFASTGLPSGRAEAWRLRKRSSTDDRWVAAVEDVPSKFDLLRAQWGTTGSLSLLAPDYVLCGLHMGRLGGEVLTQAGSAADVAALALEFVQVAAREPGMLTGYVHVDSIADPYTKIVTMSARLRVDDFRVEVPGYYWSLLLREGHIERLGGAEAVRSGPCERVEELSDGSLLCLLTEDCEAATIESYEAWREFLLPVLRPGFPVGLDEDGFAWGSTPVWVLEGPPTPDLTVLLLTSERPSPIPVAGEVPSGPSAVRVIAHGLDPVDRGVVWAVVHGWHLTSQYRGLGGTTAPLGGWRIVGGGPEGQDDPTFEIDFADCEPAPALERLGCVLAQLNEIRGREVIAGIAIVESV